MSPKVYIVIAILLYSVSVMVIFQPDSMRAGSKLTARINQMAEKMDRIEGLLQRVLNQTDCDEHGKVRGQKTFERLVVSSIQEGLKTHLSELSLLPPPSIQENKKKQPPERSSNQQSSLMLSSNEKKQTSERTSNERSSLLPSSINKRRSSHLDGKEIEAKPRCFEDAGMRLSTLQGTWEQDHSTPAYWNMSCKLEVFKYSCVAHGNVQHALKSRYTFIPRNCSLATFDASALARALGKRPLHFIGDSLLEQVYSAFGCQLGKDITVVTPPKPGVIKASFTLRSGPEVRFTAVWQTNSKMPPPDGGVAIIEAGVHSGQVQALRQQNFSKIFWLATPPQSFMSKNKDGAYDEAFLAAQGGVQRCQAKTGDGLREKEERMLREGGSFGLLDGVVALEGIGSMGHTKVGGAVGKYGDCSHYCAPGIPDQLARVVFSMLVSGALEEDASAPTTPTREKEAG